jgi:cysteine-S-conjugate beta-lyase
MEIFDTLVDRTHTHCEKWEKYKEDDVIPMWVADMDFKSPQCIIDALKVRVEHGIFGYTRIDEGTNQAVVDFLYRHHGWKVKKEWIVWIPGVVSGMNITCKMVEGGVITTTPIYPHFVKAPKNAKKELSQVPLIQKNNRWTIDFEAFEKAINPTCKLFMLCNPYNPGGTVFTKNELEKLAHICEIHNLLICSDEIHSDLILNKNAKHIPIATLSEWAKENTITLLAPSKTFNIAGLQSSYAVIPNVHLRKDFQRTIGDIAHGINLLAVTATRVAYTSCDGWLEKLKLYLARNLKLVEDFVAKNPRLKLLNQEATFLSWIDATSLHVENPYEYFLSYGVGLSDGEPFGNKNFIRLNFGCPRSMLENALLRMQNALDDLK